MAKDEFVPASVSVASNCHIRAIAALNQDKFNL